MRDRADAERAARVVLHRHVSARRSTACPSSPRSPSPGFVRADGSARSSRRAIPTVLPHGPRHVATPDDQIDRDSERRVSAVSGHSARRARRTVASRESCASFKPDIVHSATEFMIGRLGQIAAKRAGIVRLSSYHTDFSRYTEAYGMPWLRSAVSRLHRALPFAERARLHAVAPGARRPHRARRARRRGVGPRRRHRVVLADATQPAAAQRLRHRRLGGLSARRTARRRKGRRQDRARVPSCARAAAGGRRAPHHRRRGAGRSRAAFARRPRRALPRRARSERVRCRDSTRAPTRFSSRRSPRRSASSCSRRWRAGCP